MAKQENSNIDDMIKSGQAPAAHGKKKRYLTDHRVIWDRDTDKALITAEGKNENGRSVIETANPEIQGKLEALGYKPEKENIRIHHGKGKNPHIKSAQQVEKENAA